MKKRWWYLLFLLPLLFKPILGILLIFLLPGLGIVLLLFKKTSLHEKISLSIALSICITILIGFILNATIGLKFFTTTPALLLITIIPLFLYYRRLDLKKINIKKPGNQKIFSILILMLSLSFLAVNVYKPHFNNPYPIHLDEYSRLLETTHIIEQETYNNRYNPQFVGHHDPPRRLNPGFQLLLSQFYIVSGVNHTTFFQYLPAFFALLTGFILFSFLTRLSDYWVGIFGIILMSFMKTNDNTLGISYLVALTMTFPLIYAMFYSFYNAFDKKESWYFLLGSFIYFTILVIHEQTGASFIPILLLLIPISALIYAIKNKGNRLISLKGIMIFFVSIIIPLFSVYIARSWLWKGSVEKTIEFVKTLIVWQAGATTFHYNFILFYGPMLSILAIVGLIFIWKSPKLSIFMIWVTVSIAQIINFSINNITYLSAIERIRHTAALSLIPLSAYGLYLIFSLISKIPKKNKDYFKKCIALSIIIIIGFISFTYVDKGNYISEENRPKDGVMINPVIDYKDYQAILYLKQNSYENVVLADPTVSASIYPISRNFIVASSQNRFDGFGGGNVQAVKSFFTTPSCLEKQRLAYQNNVKYVLSRKPINCPEFEQVYSEKFRYIYSLQ